MSGLYWLDRHRGGPVDAMTRCNLLLSRASEPAADVLVVGSSRSGVALDPVVMERILTAELTRPVRVDRLAFGRNPMRAMSGLFENYMDARGPPRVVVLELMFMTERSVDMLARLGLALAPEDYLYRRDVNVLRFDQLLTQPSVAMPFTTAESDLNLWSQRLRGVVLRFGALLYDLARNPTQNWDLPSCTRDDWAQGGGWSPDFAFSFGEFEPDSELTILVRSLETQVAQHADTQELADWQSGADGGTVYPYDFEAAYRQGEVMVLESMIERALDHDAEVILIPLPLFGYELDNTELSDFVGLYGPRVHLFDLYGAIRIDFDPLWYDDAHVERSTVGALTTALMAQRLLQSQAL